VTASLPTRTVARRRSDDPSLRRRCSRAAGRPAAPNGRAAGCTPDHFRRPVGRRRRYGSYSSRARAITRQWLVPRRRLSRVPPRRTLKTAAAGVPRQGLRPCPMRWLDGIKTRNRLTTPQPKTLTCGASDPRESRSAERPSGACRRRATTAPVLYNSFTKPPSRVDVVPSARGR